LPGRKKISARGVSHAQPLFLLASFYQKHKKLVPLIVCIPLLLLLVHYVIPKYALEDLSVGSGSIIWKGNIEEFFNHVSMHNDVLDRSLAELTPIYEVAAAYLVHILEARFVNLNPFMQQMFLKVHDIEDSEKKDFILETLRREFRDIAIEARKVFEHFNMLGSRVEVVSTTKEDIKVPIPCKFVGLHEALEKNFDWICPKNPFDEISEPKSVHKGSSKTHLDTIQFIVEKTSTIDLNSSFDIT
jgi:hypothetical protein